MASEEEEVKKTSAMEGRWQCGKTLPDCLSYMQKRDFLTDVTFIVGESKTRISAHKLIMASRSPVFSAMLYGSMQETRDISVPDMEEAAFREMLRFIYTDQVLPDEDNIEELIYAAEKYDLQGLALECENYYLLTTVPENVLMNLELADKYNMDRLKKKSSKITCKKILNNPDWFEEVAPTIKQEALSGVLGCDELSLPEIYIYRMAIKWAEAECRRQELEISDKSIRATLRSALYNIRFPLIPTQIFCKEISTKNVLSDDEKTMIFRQMILPADGIMSLFSACPRKGYPDYEYGYMNLNAGMHAQGFAFGPDQIEVNRKTIDETFTVESPRLLKGVVLAGNKGESYTYCLSLLKSTCKETIISVMGKIESIPADEFNVLLSHPIALKENEKYILRIQIDKQPSIKPSPRSTAGGFGVKHVNHVQPGRQNVLAKRLICLKD